MKDFKIDSNGDIAIKNHDIQFVSGAELTAQKARLILSTNKGEWILNADEGIDFSVMLVKNPNKDAILDTVRDGLRQIDETFRITEYEYKTVERHLILTFKAINDNEEEINLSVGEITSNERTYIIAAINAEDVLRSAGAIEAVCVCDTDSYAVKSIL